MRGFLAAYAVLLSLATGLAVAGGLVLFAFVLAMLNSVTFSVDVPEKTVTIRVGQRQEVVASRSQAA